MIRVPKVSVIVPSFNYGHVLAETLDSVLNQSLEDWECIVVDDGSTDDTATVTSAYASKDARFFYVYQQNSGLSAARNTGLREAKGEYIQLLDADDLIEIEKLREHAQILDLRKDYSLVYGPMSYFTGPSTRRVFSRGRNNGDKNWMKFWPDTNEQMLMALIQENLFPVSAPLVRKSSLIEVGYFDDSLRSHEDWEFWLRLAFAGKRFFGLDVPGTRTLIREHRRSMSNRVIIMAETRLKVRRHIEDLVETEALRLKNRECSRYDECLFGAAHIAAGHFRTGVRWYFHGIVGARHKATAVHFSAINIVPGWLLRGLRRMRKRFSKSY